MKKIKIAVISVLILVLAWFVLDIFSTVKKGYKTDREKLLEYSFLFNHELGMDQYGFYGYSWVKASDALNYYKNYPILNIEDKTTEYTTTIWEFKELKNFNLDSVHICTGIDLNSAEIKNGTLLDSEGSRPTNIAHNLNFGNSLTLNLNKETKVWEYLNGENYVGFVGRVSKMSISNEHNETQVIFPYYDGKTPIVLIFYKGYDSFFLIYVQPPPKIRLKIEHREPIDTITKDVLEYFNL